VNRAESKLLKIDTNDIQNVMESKSTLHNGDSEVSKKGKLHKGRQVKMT